MEIIKNKQWRSLPTELEKLIVEFIGCVKLRDGCIVSQISKEDPLRQVLNTIPKIVLSSYYDYEEEHEVLVSKVNITTLSVSKYIKFEIQSHILNPVNEYQLKTDQYDDKYEVYVAAPIEMRGIYRGVLLTFMTDGHSSFLNFFTTFNKFVIECDGNIVDCVY